MSHTADLLADHDATALADLVRKKAVSPLELVDATIAKIEKHDGPQGLNAVVQRWFDEARAAARGTLPDGPFTGVPFLIKDVITAVAGKPLTEGSRLGRSRVPDRDAELVRRFRRSGLVFVGKTSVPELGILPTTESVLYGRTPNPWDRSRTPGGSSGGAAVAVAAGYVPMAHASDGGGSIRIPASACGLFGMKPTRARNPLGPYFGDIMHGLVVEHALTRSVRDSARLLDATNGPDDGDPYVAPPPARKYVDEVQDAAPGKLTIAFSAHSPTGVPVHPDCVAAVRDAAALCEKLGHHVIEKAPAIDGGAMVPAFIAMWASCNAAAVEELSLLAGEQPSLDNLEPLTMALYQMGRTTSAVAHLKALGVLQAISRQVAAFFKEIDVWLTPTMAEPPPPLGTFDAQPDNPMAGFMRAAGFVPFTPVCNATGQPAMSVPLYWNDDGVPIGTQFAGRFGDEGTLFRLAAQLEQERPWAGRRPKLD